MRVDVVHLPADLTDEHLRGRVVVVFDVLRATTSMLAALNAGANEIRVFDSLDAARSAAGAFDGERLLCGETQCRRPDEFDLGNSPAEFSAKRVSGKTLFMCTTNGTKAILAAVGADEILIAALVNASVTANYLNRCGKDATLLGAGTGGKYAPEDEIGTRAVARGLKGFDRTETVLPENLAELLRATPGGQNVISAGLEADIDFAAQLDSYDFVGRVLLDPLRVVRE